MHKGQKTNATWYAEGDPWVLMHNEWDPEKSVYFETVFSQSNGYMGIRGYRDEIEGRATTLREGYLAGMFADLPPLARRLVVHDYPWESRQMVALPEIFSVWIALDGESFSLSDGTVEDFEESLDMRSGILVRKIRWRSPNRKTSSLRFTRFLCAGIPHAAVQKIEIEALDWSGRAELIWEYDVAQKTYFRCGDPAKPHVACPHCAVVTTAATNERVSGMVVTEGTQHNIAYASRVDGPGGAAYANPAGLLSQSSLVDVRKGETASWVRWTAVVTSRDEWVSNPLQKAEELVDSLEFDRIEEEQKSIWSARWKDADIQISGCDHDQLLIRYGIYNLLQMAPCHADNLSIPARCYAYNRYNGLYFWDGEIFLLPFYQFCAPQVARNLVGFRCRTLPGARRNAELLGGKGAIFPWQGDADEGLEQAPWGLYEYLWHQSADIVYAFDQYARASGDKEFMFGPGLEVLAETSRFWLSKLQQDDEGFYHLDGTVGPDEAEEHGIDNGYTCLMVQRSLEISVYWWRQAAGATSDAAAETAARLGLSESEIASWAAAASRMNIPEVPDCPGVPLQDEFLLQRKPEDISGMTVPEYWERRGEVQVIKQADIVLAMYLLEDRFSRDEIKRGYEFYEPMTLHVSSLSYNTHSIVAAIIGHEKDAYDYFRKAAGLDLDNLRNATKDGLHAAALGAVWQMAIPGFMGMRVRQDHLYFQPAPPKAWTEVRFPIHYRGWRLECTAKPGSFHVEVSGKGMPDSTLKIGEEAYALKDGILIKSDCRPEVENKGNTEWKKSKQLSLT